MTHIPSNKQTLDQRRLAAVISLHHMDSHPTNKCVECNKPWPCPTAKAVVSAQRDEDEGVATILWGLAVEP